MQSAEGEKIVIRFFEVLDDMVLSKKVPSVYFFCENNKINRGNMSQARKDPKRDIFKLDWIHLLVSKYGVSAKYLILGQGEMYEEEVFLQEKGNGQTRRPRNFTKANLGGQLAKA